MSSEIPVPSPGVDPTFQNTTRRRAATFLTVRGILAVLLGLILFIAPVAGGLALGAFMVISIGVWLVIDGVIGVSIAFRGRRNGAKGWGWSLLSGIAAIIVGALALIFPFSTGVYLGIMVLWFMALGLFLRGLLALGHRPYGGWSIALSIINMLFGLWLALTVFVAPLESLTTLVWVGGIYGIAFGVSSLVAAYRVRKAA